MEAVATKASFQKYPAYKDSGVEWLGEIPMKWDAVRMKFLFRDISIKNRPEQELLSVTQDKGVVPRTWVENRMVMPSGGLESFKFIQKGDFAISLRSFEGGLEYCHHDGIISPAYTVLRKRSDLIDTYYKYLFKSFSFISEIQTSVVGIREGKNISYPELSYSLLPIPSQSEQTAIANFLDDKTAKIDKAIAQKERMIALLKERKQIIIQNAVTKGLDPNVKMKDSGVEWIGEIPEGWEVKQSQWLFSERKERARKDDVQLTSSQKHGVIPQKEYMEIEGRRVTVVEFNKEIQKHVEQGDFMISMRSFQGGLEYSKYDGCISSAYISLIPSENINHGFYKYLFKCQRYIEALQSTSNLVRDGQALRFENFKQVPLLLIPNIEQEEISKYIETQSNKKEQAIALQQTQIERLKEYKATLIDGAVTGKIKVG